VVEHIAHGQLSILGLPKETNMSKQLLLFDPRVPPWVRRLCDRIDPEKRLGAAVVLVWHTQRGQEHLLACVGWIAVDVAAIVGVILYG
jgi:hypothetical protein